jgi:hypothetical protein
MKKSIFLLIILLSISLKCQEYEIAWQKDIGGTYAQFSKDGEFIYVAGGNTISKYRSSDGSFVSTFDGTGFVENDIPIYGIFYLSGQGNYLTVCTDRFSIWDTRTEKGVRQIQKINCMDISSDENQLIIADDNSIYKTTFNDIIRLKTVKVNEQIIYLKVSHNGKMFSTASISGSKYYLTLWDTETLTEIKRTELIGCSQNASFYNLNFSLDDNIVFITTPNPEKSFFFYTKDMTEAVNSLDYDKRPISSIGMTSDFFLFFYFDNVPFTYSLKFVNINTKKLNQELNTITYYIITSSNNLIFTGTALLKPKTVDVSEPIKPSSEISISPNPAGDYVEISYSPSIKRGLGGVSYEIFNIFGENTTPSNLAGLPPLLSKEGIIKINVSNLAPGVYFIRIGDKFEKFIKW